MINLRLARRLAVRQPMVSALAVIARALGIGLGTLTFSILNGAVNPALCGEQAHAGNRRADGGGRAAARDRPCRRVRAGAPGLARRVEVHTGKGCATCDVCAAGTCGALLGCTCGVPLSGTC